MAWYTDLSLFFGSLVRKASVASPHGGMTKQRANSGSHSAVLSSLSSLSSYDFKVSSTTLSFDASYRLRMVELIGLARLDRVLSLHGASWTTSVCWKSTHKLGCAIAEVSVGVLVGGRLVVVGGGQWR